MNLLLRTYYPPIVVLTKRKWPPNRSQVATIKLPKHKPHFPPNNGAGKNPEKWDRTGVWALTRNLLLSLRSLVVHRLQQPSPSGQRQFPCARRPPPSHRKGLSVGLMPNQSAWQWKEALSPLQGFWKLCFSQKESSVNAATALLSNTEARSCTIEV